MELKNTKNQAEIFQYIQSKGDSPYIGGGGKIAEWRQNSKAKKKTGPRGHLTDYLPTLRGQSWTFD